MNMACDCCCEACRRPVQWMRLFRLSFLLCLLLISVLLLLSGCVSAGYHSRAVRDARLEQIDFAIGVAEEGRDAATLRVLKDRRERL